MAKRKLLLHWPVCANGCTFQEIDDGWTMQWCPLHAAAPELLEALEALYDSAIEGHDDFSRYIAEQAGPAIAKARGES